MKNLIMMKGMVTNMDYEIIKGNEGLYEDIIDFGNYVFGLDFPSLLPKLYQDHKETAKYHYIVKKDQRIRAMVGSFPLGLTVCGTFLKGSGIGTVSVHKYHRGSGYMRKLMDKALADMIAEGCDFAVLGGQRQRYEYWGFTPCGITVMLNFNSSNIKHCHINQGEYKFIEYNHTLVNDLDKAVKLHDLQPVHGVRKKTDFIEITKSWCSRILFVYQGGEFIGYISASDDNKSIKEILLYTPVEIDKVIVSYMKSLHLSDTNVVLPMYRSMEFMRLSSFCEDYTIKHSANIYIINYTRVLKTFMSFKNSLCPLEEGTLILNVKGNGNYKIEIKDRAISVLETDQPYDLSLSHLEASALLFSHSSFVNSVYNYTKPFIKSWFPLPLYYPELDNV